MKKFNWNRILNISLIVLTAFCALLVIFFGTVQKPLNKVFAEDLVEGIPFKSGVINRNANNFVNNSFNYTDDGGYFNGSIETVFQNDYVMLTNYNAEIKLSSLGETTSVQNMFLSFGADISTLATSEDGTIIETVESLKEKNIVLLTGLEIKATLNGETIDIGTPTKYNVAGLLPENLTDAYSWFLYLDGKNFGEGLYNFDFRYNYALDGKIYNSKLYNYSFYLMDQGKYATYPKVLNSEAGNPSSNNIVQYFYNYEDNSYPAYTYDAYRYNVSYTRTKNKETEIVTTSFSLNELGLGTLVINSSITGTKTFNNITKNDNGEYFVSLEFDTLGTYDFTNKYLVKTADGFTVVENILAYDVNNKVEITDVDNNKVIVNGYEEGILQKGYVKLHVYGIKAYYTKNGTGVELKNDEIKSDLTSKVKEYSDIQYDFGFAKGLKEKIGNNFTYPTTNLAPIYFDYYGTFNFNNAEPKSKFQIYNNDNFDGEPISTGYLTKDSVLNKAGYYELVFDYSFELYSVGEHGGATTRKQVFAFRIDNSTPEVELEKTDGVTTSVLKNDEFTNQNVIASWPYTTEFQADIRAILYKTSPNGTTAQTSYQKENIIGNDVLDYAKYRLRIYFTESDDVYVEYSFTIDKLKIANIEINAIDAVYDSENPNTPSGFRLITDPNIVNFNNSTLINQPFTLTYSPKPSGAKISTVYYKIPFSFFNKAGSTVTNDYSKILTNYQIDPSTMSAALEYVIDYYGISNKVVDPQNAFNENRSFIYFFSMIDEAGNTDSRYVIYDLTKPYVIMDADALTPGIQNIENSYNIVNKQAQIIWGNYKAIEVKADVAADNTVTNAWLNAVIQTERQNGSGLFQLHNGKYYMCVPIKKVFAIESVNNITISGSAFVNNVMLYPEIKTTGSAVENFFSGEKTYDYYVTDTSHITSSAGIAKSNITSGFIQMNLDNSMGIAYGTYENSDREDNLGEPLRADVATSVNQLRFSYYPGDTTSDYYVKSVTYSYFQIDQSSYTTVSDNVENNESYIDIYKENTANGIPYSVYPYEKIPSIGFDTGKITISTLKVSGEDDRVVSDIINPVSVGTSIKTKEGMYVIKREYYKTDAELSDSLDKSIRYYYFFVDRSGIIQIGTDDGSSEDVNIYETDGQPDMLYEIGSGILFNFGKTENADPTNPNSPLIHKTYYTAKQIQQYLAFSGGSKTIFDSNKLPITFNLPTDKYNSKFVLNKMNSSASYINDYINPVATQNNYQFKLRYLITYSDTNSSESGSFPTVVDTTNPSDIKINLDYLIQNGYNSYSLKKAGTYNVTIFDNSESRLYKPENIIDQKNNSISFSLIISHESPSGNYYSKYNDENKTEMLLTTKHESLNETEFKSFNNNSLKFVFNKYDNKYRAEIDPTNIVVKRNGVEIYKKVNEPIDNNILTYEGNELEGKYTLTIFDEDEYLQNNKSYLGGSGNNRDYLLSKNENITYTVTLQYIGNKEDYVTDEGVNYFSKDFTITLDRIKPQYNFNKVVENDNLKYGVSNNINMDASKYFYPINETFNFVQDDASGGELDSETIFIRMLNDSASFPVDYPEYYRTLTPDDEDYYLDGLTNHIRFSEANQEFIKCAYNLDPVTGKISIDAKTIFSNYGKGSGYYEVIERDEANNYKVYAVQYMESSVSPPNIQYNYNPAIVGTAEDGRGEINAANNTPSILGTELQFTSIDSNAIGENDYFYKCSINYNGVTETVYNNPNDRSGSTSWDYFINTINSKLEFANVASKDGYNITIRFYNRFSDDYVINYRVPGDRLEPIFADIDSERFSITIPADKGGNYIKKFKAYKFVNGEWVELFQDIQGNTIINESSDPEHPSLQNLKYIFGLGEFKFVLIDVFDRGVDESLDPPYYKGKGVNDVNQINYGVNQLFENKYYTSGTVQLKYQTNLYKLVISVYNSVTTNYDEVLEDQFNLYNITEQNIVDGIRTLNFDNPVRNTAVTFKVKLIVEKAGSVTEYNFVINRTLPDIELRNLSGGKISSSNLESEPTIHTENFTVNWENNVFNPSVNLKRVYTDASGKLQTQTIYNIANGYQINMPGTYTASITNNLNYTDSSKNIYFKLVSGEIVVYDVVAINALSETILTPSPITSTITIDGVTKVLYRYYALKSFNNVQGSIKYIELRVNKNKGLEYTLLNPDNENSKQYKIYGTSNYGYERYIEIVFVDEVIENDATFANVFVGTPQIVDGRPTGTLTEIPIKNDENVTTVKEITTIADSVTIRWNSYFAGSNEGDITRGNIIFADYYFNGQYAKTISTTSGNISEISIKTAGIHRFEFKDLAGNKQTFFGSDNLTVNLVNDVLFNINNANPINNQIFNGDVILSVTNRHLYSTDPIVTATLNNEPVEVDKVGTSFNDYKFSKQGYYEVTIKTRVHTNSETNEIATTYCFTIINEKQALPCFNVPQNANFKVVKVLKESADITYTLTNLNELWISPATLGSGNYTITLSKYNDELDKNIEFTFKIWINNETPYILSSQAFGTSTTKKITLSYNPKIIFDQIGDSYIKIDNEATIHINEESPNEITTYTLANNKTYYIQIFSSDNKLITSYKVTKNEPLNTTAIIIIVIVSIIVVALVIVFIVIRRHLKFR